MKTLVSGIAAVILSGAVYAQEATNAMSIGAGGTFGKAKIVPKMEKLGVAQFTVDYKQVTTKTVTQNEKKFNGIGKSVKASGTAILAAYLETTDGDLTDQDYQEITDHGYSYLQKQLKAAGYDTVAWSTISNTEFFKNSTESNEEKDSEAEEKNGQQWVTYNALKGGTMSRGKPADFAFGKAKKVSRFCGEIDAPAAFFHTSVDFVEILIDMDISTRNNRSYYNPKEITAYKTKAQAGAMMKIPENPGMTTFINEKLQSEVLAITQQIPAEVNLESTLSEDASRLTKKNKLFSVSLTHKMESTPIVISTTRTAYKEAAKKTLEKYVDTFIAKAKEIKKA